MTRVMEKVSTDGIEPAIIDAGYSPIRIDRKLDVRKIDDEIVAEIRRSLFLAGRLHSWRNKIKR